MSEDFDCFGKWRNHGWNPSLAFGLFDEKAKLFECGDPNRPECGKVLGVDDENNVINVCKDLYNVVGVSVRQGESSLVKEMIDSGTKVCAKDRSGEALALKYALCDF